MIFHRIWSPIVWSALALMVAGGMSSARAQDTTVTSSPATVESPATPATDPAAAGATTGAAAAGAAATGAAATTTPATAAATAPAAVAKPGPSAPPKAEPPVGLLQMVGADNTQKQIDAAKVDEQRNNDLLAALDADRRDAHTNADVGKSEVDILNKQIDIAKKTKNDTLRLQLERQKKIQELERTRREYLAKVKDAERDVAQKEKDYAQAKRRRLETQLALINRNESRGPSTVPDPETAKLERQLLLQYREEADKRKAAADRQKEVADQTLQLYDAQAKLAASIK